MNKRACALFVLGAIAWLPSVSKAALFTFDNGAPDGRLGAGARLPGNGLIEIETADDFITSATQTTLTSATFTGLLPTGTPLANVSEVAVSIYRVFPNDSANPPDGKVPTRVNSPADVEIVARNSLTPTDLSFTSTLLNASFSANNSVLNGINPFPNQTTGGEGPLTGEEVQFNLNFSTPISLAPSHYFFVPQVLLPSGSFYWLTSPGPAGPPDLQSWTRNTNLDPDWLRIGTDIVGGGARFNQAFTLAGAATPEPSSIALLGSGLAALAVRRRRRAA